MAQSISTMFYNLGGYVTESDKNPYVSVADVTGTYVPMATTRFNSLCYGAATMSVVSDSCGDVYNDRIIAELSLFFADSSYDTLHVDPDTYQVENRHYTVASKMILDRYGIRDRKTGEIYFPCFSDDNRPYSDIGISTLSY